MKCAVKKMVGDEDEAGRLTTISDHYSGIGPTKKKKNLIYIYIYMFLKKLLPVSLHLWLHFFPTFPLHFCPFISPLLSILSLYFLLLSFVLTLLLPILFSINLIYFFNLIHIFPHRKLSSLSLSLSPFFSWIFVISYNSN